MGVHRKVLMAAEPDILSAVATAWRRFGLVETDEEAASFMAMEQPTLRQRLAGFFRA
jgi:hypothetical protein